VENKEIPKNLISEPIEYHEKFVLSFTSFVGYPKSILKKEKRNEERTFSNLEFSSQLGCAKILGFKIKGYPKKRKKLLSLKKALTTFKNT